MPALWAPWHEAPAHPRASPGGAAAPARSPARRLPWAYLALALFAATSLTANALGFVLTLPRLEDAGYPDTFYLYDAREYARTGRIYRGPTEAPYNPSPYSPLFYLVLSLPFRVSEPSNPFLAPRLIVGAFFALCVLVSATMAHALARHRSVVVWSGLLGLSIVLVSPWLSPVRTDFMGVFFGLLSARLLMTRWRWAPLLAGLAAGASFAFKLTLVAAALSGLAWLLWSRRYRGCLQFLAGAALTGVGGYLVFLPFEPHMAAHLFAMRTSLLDFDYADWTRLVHTVAAEPVFLLALSVLPLALRRSGPKRRLVLLYGAASFLIASVTAFQPGANTNYFMEFLLLSVPLASVAAVRLFRIENRAQIPQIVLAAMILVFPVKAALSFAKYSLTRNVPARNAEWVGLEALLRDKRVFSAVPQVAFLTRTPPLTEPYLTRLLEKEGRFDTGPLSDRIRAREFDLVVTRLQNDTYRGIEHLSPAFRSAIRSAYAPFCAMSQQLFHLPREQREPEPLGDGLLRLGCTPMRDVKDKMLVSW